MKKKFDLSELYLRIALGVGFILPVMDRFGWLGIAGQRGTAWGNWDNFVSYTHTLMPYMNDSLTRVFATLATASEILFGIMLIIGYKIRLAALGSFLLTLGFALSMLFFANYRAPFSYSVFVCSAASLFLACKMNSGDQLDRL
ncbi:DoxX family membrane protein [Pedobacter antarcticus]|uniref:DoxX family membrane protein n=1 Tax=Pedobacter antarcticus TaxID=34086 RepID=UPI00292D4347|nr:DoxX family membrane protein [Pedobacter antarcticus]